jgi:hypothetical protein
LLIIIGATIGYILIIPCIPTPKKIFQQFFHGFSILSDLPKDNHRSRNSAAAADSSAATAALHSTWGDGSELVQEELQRLQEATTQSLEAGSFGPFFLGDLYMYISYIKYLYIYILIYIYYYYYYYYFYYYYITYFYVHTYYMYVHTA